MMFPSVFGENLFDDWMDDFGFRDNFFSGKNPLYGKHLPYESPLLLILNIFFSMFLLYHTQEEFTNICSVHFQK